MRAPIVSFVCYIGCLSNSKASSLGNNFSFRSKKSFLRFLTTGANNFTSTTSMSEGPGPQQRKAFYHRSPLLPRQDADVPPTKQALILLNAPLGDSPSPLLRKLWETADVRICADGGANRLFRLQISDWIPTAIVGDLDSVHSSVREYYEAKGVSVQCNPDQDLNDFDKALTAAVQQYGCERCVVFGAFGGRFDQEMGCLQGLYKWSSTSSNSSPSAIESTEPEKGFRPSIWLYDDHTMACFLPADSVNHIELALPSNEDHAGQGQQPVGEGPTCGLIPLGAPCESITTTGFQWNLTNHPTSFGGLVSTSNRLDGSPVTVIASSPIIFTAEVHCGRESHWSS